MANSLTKKTKYQITITYSDGIKFVSRHDTNYAQETIEKIWKQSGNKYWSRVTNKIPTDDIKIKNVTIKKI